MPLDFSHFLFGIPPVVQPTTPYITHKWSLPLPTSTSVAISPKVLSSYKNEVSGMFPSNDALSKWLANPTADNSPFGVSSYILGRELGNISLQDAVNKTYAEWQKDLGNADKRAAYQAAQAAFANAAPGTQLGTTLDKSGLYPTSPTTKTATPLPPQWQGYNAPVTPSAPAPTVPKTQQQGYKPFQPFQPETDYNPFPNYYGGNSRFRTQLR